MIRIIRSRGGSGCTAALGNEEDRRALENTGRLAASETPVLRVKPPNFVRVHGPEIANDDFRPFFLPARRFQSDVPAAVRARVK
jgi:hypothetical protein